MVYVLKKTFVLWRSAFHKNIIFGPINKTTLVKNEHLTNRTNPWAEKNYKVKDNISDNYKLVYRDESTVNIIAISTYHIGWIGLAANTLILGYLIYKKPVQKESKYIDRLEIKPLSSIGRISMMIVSFTICGILIISSRAIPLRIYYNSKEKIYKAIFVNRIFGKKEMETFGEGTAVPIFSKYLGTLFCRINKRIVILDEECFPVPSIREKMIRKTD